MMPDPAFYADCLLESFEELRKVFRVDEMKSEEVRTATRARPPGKAQAKKTTKKKKIRKAPVTAKKASTKST
jgi:hypothetical protein